MHEHLCPRCNGLWSHAHCNLPLISARLDPRCEAEEANVIAEADAPTAPTPDDQLEGEV